MKYKMNTPFAGFSTDFIFISVNRMYHFEVNYGTLNRLLDNDEQMDIFMMQIGCMPSEIGVS